MMHLDIGVPHHIHVVYETLYMLRVSNAICITLLLPCQIHSATQNPLQIVFRLFEFIDKHLEMA